MNLLLVIYSGANRELVPALFDQHAVSGYTEFGNAHGHGRTGRRAGTRAWPADSVVYFSIVPSEKVPELTQAFHSVAQADTGERLHVAVMPTETFF